MKKLSILLFLFSASLSAQYARMQFLLQNAQGQVISGASVYVYSQTACGAASGALATIYPSSNGGTPTQQPLHTNGKGEAFTYAAPGCYTVVYNSPSTGTQTYPDQIVGGNGPQGPPGPQGIPGAGNIAASPQFSIMYQPIPGTQSAAQGDPGVTSDGAGTLKAKVGFGIPQAAQYPTGLIGAMGTNQSVVSSVDDSITATNYSFTNMIPNVPNNFMWTDYRKNNQGVMEFVHNWGVTRNVTFSGTPDARSLNCLMDGPYNLAINTSTNCAREVFYDTTPGINLGNPSVQANPVMNWVTNVGHRTDMNSNGAGIREGMFSQLYHFGQGDTANYGIVWSHGGYRDVSGEGVGNYFQSNEETIQFRETCTTGCTTGSKIVKGTITNGSGTQGVRCCVIDTTVGPTANTLTALGVGLQSTIEAITVGTAVPVSVAWGTLAAPVQPSGADLSGPPYGTTLSFTVTVTTGTFDSTHLMCFASQYHEQIIPTSVTNPTGPTATVTALIRRPHASGTVVMQGGMCGYGGEIIAETVGTNRYLFDVLGSTTANIVQGTWFHAGSNTTTNFGVGFNADLTGSTTTTGLSSNGTTVYATGVANGTTATLPSRWNKVTVVFSASSDGALNGTNCTALTWLSSNAFTCTMAGLTGTHTATTSTVNFATAAANTVMNTVNFWPMAEVLDVQNESLTPPSMDGTLVLEPNVIAFSASDVIAELNDSAGHWSGVKSVSIVSNPYSLTSPFTIIATGAAHNGGGNGTTLNALMAVNNQQNNNIYSDNGGRMTPPNFISMTGSFANGFVSNEGPANNNSMYNITPSANQKNNPNYLYNLFLLSNLASSSIDQINPFLGDRAISASGQLRLGGSGANVKFTTSLDSFTVTGAGITGAAIANPTISTVAAGPGAGNTAVIISGNSYCYTKVSRAGAGGFTAQSVEVCGTASTNGTMKVSWPRLAGASDGNATICGRTTGAELSMVTTVAEDTLYWVDDGSITPSGACSVTNATIPALTNFSQLTLNSSGTAFTATFKAPASAAGNYTVTLPAITSTLAVLGANTFTATQTVPSIATSTNCAVNSVSPAACGAAPAGAVVIPTTTTTYTVNTTAVTAASRIFLFPMSFAGNLPSSPTCVAPAVTSATTVSAIVAATSFTIALPSTTGQTCWQYMIMN